MISKLSVILCITSGFLAAVSQILLKAAAKKKHKNFLRQYLNIWVAGGYLLLLCSLLLNFLAYQWMDYKYGPVFASTSYIFVLILSSLVFKEKITVKMIIGNICIVCGIIVFCL